MTRSIASALTCAAILCAGCGGVSYLDPRGPRIAGRGEPPADPTPELVVVTFNIQYAQRIDEAIRALRGHPRMREVDVLLLQEMDRPGTRAIARALRFHYVFYPTGTIWSGRELGNAILSRWPILRDRKIVLPEENPFNAQRRIAVSAILDAPGGAIAAYSVHNETALLSLRGRLEQVEAILDDAARVDAPCVIGGDFNTMEPQSIPQTVQRFAMLGFRHASRRVPRTADYLFGGLILDHVFVRDLRAIDAGAPPTNASDHRPLWVRLVRARQ